MFHVTSWEHGSHLSILHDSVQYPAVLSGISLFVNTRWCSQCGMDYLELVMVSCKILCSSILYLCPSCCAVSIFILLSSSRRVAHLRILSFPNSRPQANERIELRKKVFSIVGLWVKFFDKVSGHRARTHGGWKYWRPRPPHIGYWPL